MTSSPLNPSDDRVKVAHLVLGLLLLGIAGAWALISGDVITADRLSVLAPGLLIAAGVIGLTASLATARRGQHDPDPAGYDPYDPDPYDTYDLRRRGEDPTQEIR